MRFVLQPTWGKVTAVDWQEVMALLVVAVTAALFAWHALRRRKGLPGRLPCAGCGGMGTRTATPPEVLMSARKGGLKRVVIRMK